jgi:hypothetical protein
MSAERITAHAVHRLPEVQIILYGGEPCLAGVADPEQDHQGFPVRSRH